jgi:hypothetical protein
MPGLRWILCLRLCGAQDSDDYDRYQAEEMNFSDHVDTSVC